MKHLLTRSLFLALAAQSFTVLCAEPQKNAAPFRRSARYNAWHAFTTAGSYAGAFVLTTASEFMAAFAVKNPYMAIALKYGGLATGAGLIGATPYLTNQALYKRKYLTKEEAAYSRNQLFMHGAIRLAAFVLMYKYGNSGINATKDLLFKLCNR